ncbi:MAG: helix-turn-helix domain-containing protein [Ancrocorticia sp.]
MSTEVSQPELLRAMAHPARWMIIEELSSGRSITATQAAKLAGITPSAASYHLRHLAKSGLVTPLQSDDGRERPWAATSRTPALTMQPSDQLGSAMMQNLLESVARTLGTPPPGFDDARPWPAAFSKAELSLTPEQAKELHQKIRNLMDEYEEAHTNEQTATNNETGTRNDPTFTYQAFWILGAVADRD